MNYSFIKIIFLSVAYLFIATLSLNAQNKINSIYNYKSVSGSYSTEINVFKGASKNRKTTINWEKDIWLKTEGYGIDSIHNSGYLEIEDSYNNVKHYLRITQKKNNELYYTYKENDKSIEFSPKTNLWHQNMLKNVIYPYLKAVFYNRFFRNSEELITVQKGSKFPYFNTIDINGNKISSDDIKGKITIINFWNVFCHTCIEEIPELNRLVKKFDAPDKYVFLAFSSSTGRQIKSLLRRLYLKFDYRHIPDSDALEKQLAFQFNPVSFILDKNGVIVYMKVGFSSENVSLMEEIIEKEN
jgi:thiol-disulfide isomerase/thioredoxin